MYRILIVDDHPVIGEGTKQMIEVEQDMTVMVYQSAVDALNCVKSQMFDLMLIDLNMPVINGYELARRVTDLEGDIPILIYSGYDIMPNFNLLVEVGVSGFVSKTATRDQLITAIRCALRRESVLPVTLLRQLRRKDATVGLSASEGDVRDVSVTEKEQKILHEISDGKSNKEIAHSLLMSQRSVEYHLTNLFRKLNVRSRSETIVEARRLGLLPDYELNQE